MHVPQRNKARAGGWDKLACDRWVACRPLTGTLLYEARLQDDARVRIRRRYKDGKHGGSRRITGETFDRLYVVLEDEP